MALERLWFSNSTYSSKGYGQYPKKTKTFMIYSMNVNKERVLKHHYNQFFEQIKDFNESIFQDKSYTFCSFDTLPSKDWRKYDMSVFNKDSKIKRRKEIFPQDLEKAYKLGYELFSLK